MSLCHPSVLAFGPPNNASEPVVEPVTCRALCAAGSDRAESKSWSVHVGFLPFVVQ